VSINFLCGKPRNGKSLYAMRLIERALLNDSRIVVTNVAIKWDEFKKHLEERGFSGELEKRLQILEGEEVKSFYRFRGRGRQFRMGERGKGLEPLVDCSRVYLESELLASELESQGLKVFRDDSGIWATPGNGHGRAGGVVYVLDEIHVHFDSRAWAQTGASATFYNTQHGKLSDDVALVTQHVELVEKRFRLLAQEFVYLRNLKKSSFGFGMFRMPGVFMRTHYLQPFTGGAGQRAMEIRTFTLDYALADFHETAAGVGFIGGDADKKEKARGAPWQIFAVLVAGVLVGRMFVPDLFAKMANHVMGKTVKSVVGAVPTISGTITTNAPAAPLPMSVVPAVVSTEKEPVELVTGLASFGGRTYVTLDSGRVVVALPEQVLEYRGLVGTPQGVFKWKPLRTSLNPVKLP